MYSLREIFIYNEKAPLIFTQGLFWIWFAVIMLLYTLVYRRNGPRMLYLLAFSLFIYYKQGGYFFFLLLFSTVLDYTLGNLIHNSTKHFWRKLYIGISVVVNLGVLAYFKYAYFFIDSINEMFGGHLQTYNYLAAWTNTLGSTNFDVSEIILPVGISFYTFQTISYSVDIYRGKIAPARNIFDFGFFVTFFPQLVAGPIVRANEFLPQMYKPYSVTREDFNRAIFLILNGLIKKMLISDFISINFVDRVFDNPKVYSGLENLLAVYGYTLQIYCDFSGYTDIAIGIALLLGFSLPINFNSPYKALNITDFWRRWHISLSTWLRDYLYIPLGGNRKGKFRQYFNLFLTMLLGGLWHGAHIRFIIWGALHGLALAFHKGLMTVFPSKAKPNAAVTLITGIITFHFVAFCWIFFRAPDLATVNDVLYQILHSFKPEIAGDVLFSYRKIFAIMALGYLVHFLPLRTKDAIKSAFMQMPLPVKAVAIAVVVLVLYQVSSAGVQPFIYFQF